MPEITNTERQWIEATSRYHQANGNQGPRISAINDSYAAFARALMANVPYGHHREQALLRLVEAKMWANTAIVNGGLNLPR